MSRAARMRVPNHACTASYVRLIVQLLDQTGHDGQALARRAGIDERALQAADGWISNARVMTLWRDARAVTGNEGFGLAVAGGMGPESFALLGHSLMLGRTLGEAYRRAARDLHLLGDLFDILIEDHGDAVHLRLQVNHGEQATPECIDAGLAAILVTGRRLCADPELKPLRVEMRRPAPADVAPFVQLFGCPIAFDATEDRLSFDPADMARPVFSGHPALAEIFDRQVAACTDDGIVGRLRRRMIAALADGVPTLETLAAELHVSPRTLHRRLADEGHRFRQLLDETRRELAGDYVRRTDLPLNRIADLLGFAEAASFSRAYRRWYGSPPARHR
ncbi:MAG: AraC family transcriptional regulator [Chromatiales bacterium]|nr:AraC family transcriptional regulator [Chromatiales bacterium]